MPSLKKGLTKIGLFYDLVNFCLMFYYLTVFKICKKVGVYMNSI